MKIDLKCGDCLQLMKDIPDKSVDMILCDLPYGTTACKWDNVIPFEPLWEQYNRIIKDNGAIVLFGSEPFASKLRLSNLKMYKYDWIWNKDKSANFAQSNKRPHNIYETICVFYKKQCLYNPQKIDNPKGKRKTYTFKQKKYEEVNLSIQNKYVAYGKNYQGDKLLPKNILRFNKVEKRIHPTEKPILLLEYLIKTYTNENEVVLDNCMGSGSTGVACVNINRNFIGIELDNKYFEIAEKRIKEAQDGDIR